MIYVVYAFALFGVMSLALFVWLAFGKGPPVTDRCHRCGRQLKFGETRDYQIVVHGVTERLEPICHECYERILSDKKE